MLKVKDCMTKDVITVKPSTPLCEVVEIFATRVIGGIPVVDDEGHLVGLITKKHLLSYAMPEYFKMLDDVSFISDFGALEREISEELDTEFIVVADVMDTNVKGVSEEDSILKAALVLDKTDCSVLPVVREGKVVGIISRTDVFRAMFGRACGLGE